MKVPAAPSLSECAIWIVASIRITTVFPRSTSATVDGGIAPCRSLISFQTFQENRILGLGAAMSVLTFLIVMAVSFLYIRLVGWNIRGLAED